METFYKLCGLFLILWSVFDVSQQEDNQCRTVEQMVTQCVGPQIDSQLDQLSFSCPTDHLITNLRGAAYRSTSVDCPGAAINASCRYSSVDRRFTESLELCRGARVCEGVVVAPPPPESKDDECLDQGVAGVYFYTVSYRCEPQFRLKTTSPAWATSMEDTSTGEGSLININSLMSALMGNFVNHLDTYCSIHIPAGLEVIVRPLTFVLVPQGSRGQCVRVIDGEREERRICGKNAPEIKLGCVEYDRRVNVVYATNDSTVGVVFVVQLQVSHTASITATCGLPLDSDMKLDQPAQQPAQQPDTGAVKVSTEQPAVQPEEQPVVQADEQPVEQPQDQPVEQPDEQPVEEPHELPTVRPEEQPAEQPNEQPVDHQEEQPVEEPNEQPAEQPAWQSDEQPDEQPDEFEQSTTDISHSTGIYEIMAVDHMIIVACVVGAVVIAVTAVIILHAKLRKRRRFTPYRQDEPVFLRNDSVKSAASSQNFHVVDGDQNKKLFNATFHNELKA